MCASVLLLVVMAQDVKIDDIVTGDAQSPAHGGKRSAAVGP